MNDKFLELLNDRSLLASYLLSPLSNITNPENTSQFKLVRDPNWNRVNDLLISKILPVTIYNNFLTFRDTDDIFQIQGDLSKITTHQNNNVDLANLTDKKLKYDFTKEMYFDERALGNKGTRDKSLIRLLQSPAIVVSGISAKFSPENPNELCDRFIFLLQNKQAGINSNMINEEIVGIADIYLEINGYLLNSINFYYSIV